MNRILDVATSLGATLARMPSGLSVGKLGKRPEQPLRLYEFEGCPYCRKVREALSILDLEADVSSVSQGRPALPAGGDAPRREGAVPLPRRPEHRQGDVRVRRDRPLPVRRVRRRTRAVDAGGGAADYADDEPRGPLPARPRHLLPEGARAGEAPRALELRGVALLPHRARGALHPRAALSAAQRGEGEPEPRGVHGALGAHDGALPRRPEHRQRAVRVGRHRGATSRRPTPKRDARGAAARPCGRPASPARPAGRAAPSG